MNLEALRASSYAAPVTSSPHDAGAIALPAAVHAAFAADPSRPVLTHLDGTTGERTELSARTLENWIAKTANLLVDELLAEPGVRVRVDLPVHWQGWVWALACWEVGGVLDAGEDGAPDVLVTTSATADPAGAADVVGLALRPLAVPGPAPVPGVLDYDREVRSHGDVFAAAVRPSGDAPALVGGGSPGGLSGSDLVTRARAVAADWDLHGGERVLWERPVATRADVVGGLAVLLAGGSLVLIGNRTGLSNVSVMEQERVTAVAPGTDAGAGEASGAADRVRTLPPID